MSENNSDANASMKAGVEDAAILARHCERENARLARVLHDGPAQKLTAAMIELSLWKGDIEQGRAPAAADLQQLGELLQSISTEMRDVTSQLRPRALDLFGVGAALESIVAKRARSQFRQSNQSIAIDADQAIHLVRITEALFEVNRDAVGLQVDFEQAGAFVVLRISGVAALVVPAHALARARAFGGEIEQQGATLTLRFPATTPS
jgi:signal transduction histidine kinase